MKTAFLKIIISTTVIMTSLVSSHAADVCDTCNNNVRGLPASKSLTEISKLAKNDKLLTKSVIQTRGIAGEVEPDPDPTANYDLYCMKFADEDSLGMKKLLRGMAATSYSVDSYFEHSLCKPDAYGPTVRCPMIHKVADDPSKNERKIQDLQNYYVSVRKAPELFTAAINVQNTEGETLLDYIEYWSVKDGHYSQEQLNGPVKRIKELLCKNGGVYIAYPNKECPR